MLVIFVFNLVHFITYVKALNSVHSIIRVSMFSLKQTKKKEIHFRKYDFMHVNSIKHEIGMKLQKH